MKDSVGKDVEKLGLLHTIDRNVKWCSHYENQYDWWLFKILKVELPYDPAIPLLSIYPKEGLGFGLKAGGNTNLSEC